MQRGKPFGRGCYSSGLPVGIHVTAEVIIAIKSKNEFSKYTRAYYSGQPGSRTLMLSTCMDHSEVKARGWIEGSSFPDSGLHTDPPDDIKRQPRAHGEKKILITLNQW